MSIQKSQLYKIARMGMEANIPQIVLGESLAIIVRETSSDDLKGKVYDLMEWVKDLVSNTGSCVPSINQEMINMANEIVIVQAVDIWIIVLSASSYFGLIIGMSLLGVGTALVYPTLLAAISDIANPHWRATSLGVYRFWRDLGFVFGAVGIGFVADAFDLNIAIQTVAWISLGSGIFVLLVMHETRRGGSI